MINRCKTKMDLLFAVATIAAIVFTLYPASLKVSLSEGCFLSLSKDVTLASPGWQYPSDAWDGSGTDEWDNPTNVLKSDTYCASTRPPQSDWSDWMYTSNSAVNVDQVRLKLCSDGSYTGTIDLDGYWDGTWHDVYYGTGYTDDCYSPYTWSVFDLPGGCHSCTQFRLRWKQKTGMPSSEGECREWHWNTGCSIAPDSDDDGVPDADDNCPDVYNPSQEDINVNGIGEICETNVNDHIQATSGDSEAGLPNWDPAPSALIYEDIFRIENKSAGQSIQLPMAAVLKTLTPGTVSGDNVDNPVHSGGIPPDACWWYTEAASEGTVGDLSDGTLDPGERIARVWRFHDPESKAFTFWANAMSAGLTSKRGGGGGGEEGVGIQGQAGGGDEERLPDEPEATFDRIEGGAGGTEYYLDDGSAEIYVGSVSGRLVVVNRFDAPLQVRWSSVSFYTSGVASGGRAEVIIYEDLSGTVPALEPSMEVVRMPVLLGSGGFQEVPVGDLLLNEPGKPDAAFYVAVANLDKRSYSLGVDMTGSKAGASYLSTDGGLTFDPLSSSPIIEGNAMIRVNEKSAEPCFLGVVFN